MSVFIAGREKGFSTLPRPLALRSVLYWILPWHKVGWINKIILIVRIMPCKSQKFFTSSPNLDLVLNLVLDLNLVLYLDLSPPPSPLPT